MGDESIWKKEVSFGRKSEPKDESVPEIETPGEEEPTAAEPTKDEPEAGKETLWKREVSFERKQAPDDIEPSEEPEEPAEPIWTKEISFNRKATDEPVGEQPTAEEPTAEVPKVEESVDVGEPVTVEQPAAVVEPVVVEDSLAAEEETLQDEEVEAGEGHAFAEAEPWNAPPVMPPAAEVETPIVVHPPVPAAELPVPPADQPNVPFWKKDLSFGGKKREQTAKVDAPAPAEPNVPFWKKDLSLGGKKREKTPKVDASPAIAPDLPPSDKPNVPFWKKDLSFGGRKRDGKPKVESSPAPASELPTLVDQPSAPFWKKDLSFSGKKRGKTPKAKAESKPKVKAERKPKEPKAPKAKQPRVKAERGAKGAKRVVGLKIGASQLAAAKVSNNGTAELQQVARGPLEAGIVVGGELRDPDALSEALKEFFSLHGLPKRGVRLGLANNRIGVRTFEISGIEDAKQLANAVRFRAQEALPIPIDEAVLDYQVLGEGVTEEGEPTRRILLVVAYRELIDRYVDACKKAGITLAGIDLEAFALLRALQAPQDGVGSDPTAALVVVAIGHERATFAVSDGRVCEFTRVLDWGGSALNVAIARVLDAAPSEVEGAKRALALTDEMVPEGLTSDQAKRSREAMRRAIQAFARELVSSLQYYQNQPGSLGIGEIVLTGGTAHLPGLAGELERLIGVRVRVGDPLARMKIAKRVGEPEQIGSLAVAIGLGIED